MRARVLTLFAVLVAPVLIAAPAGAGGGGGGPCTGFTEGTEIAMQDNCFHGVAHIARPGAITVTNRGQQIHNIVAVNGAFGIKGLTPGQHYDFTVDRPGVYEYYCSIHGSASGAGMAGVLVVQDGPALVASRAKGGAIAASTASNQAGSAWGWVALGALLLAGASLCVSLAVVRPRQT